MKCDACGGTGTTGFRLMDMKAVKCTVCKGTGELEYTKEELEKIKKMREAMGNILKDE